ncbi:MAG: zinc dependent phospholipase C family protein [Methylotenera sp.]
MLHELHHAILPRQINLTYGGARVTYILRPKYWYSVVFYLAFLACQPAHSFSPETHVWIGQQVLVEAQQGFVSVGGRKYPIDAALVDALRAHPDAFLAGNIGPDAFPDPVVGQMTTHPGLKGGWQADDFLKHLLRSAKRPEELAFAYGFISHASADIFAHTYINRYAGDIFLLTDNEDTVELRHFMLEKYIGQHTPAFARDRGSYGVPAAWLRDTLIFNNEADRENQKASGTALHLSAGWAARRAVGDLERELVRIRNEVADKAADFLTLETKLAAGIPQAKVGVEIATGLYETAKKGTEIQDKALDEAVNALKLIDQTLSRNREILSLNERLIAEQARVAKDAANSFADLQNRVSQAQSEVNRFDRDLHNTPSTVEKKICSEVSKIPFFGPAIFSTVCSVVNETSDLWTSINNQLHTAVDAANRAQSDLNQAIARRAAAEAEVVRVTADSAARLQENATLEASKAGVQAAVAAKTLDAQAKQKLLDFAKQKLTEARKALDDLDREVGKVKDLHKKATDAVARIEPITAYVGNWRRDIDRAMEEFVHIGLQIGISTVRRDGETVSLYSNWWNCWAPVFQGVPSAVPQGICLLKDTYEKSTDWIVDRLGDGSWLIVPNLKLQQVIDDEIKKRMPEAVGAFVKFVTSNGDLAQMIELMASKGAISDSELAELFARDGTNKQLLLLPDIVRRVHLDMAVKPDGTFDPELFRPARNALVLAKMALLSAQQLNQLHRDITGKDGSVYGDALYPATSERFSVLFDAVRSIDGNHQWQEVALPYPKQSSIRQEWMHSINCIEQDKGCYGRPKSPGETGFHFWQDPPSREKFFGSSGTVFLGPMSRGLDDNEFVRWENYPFPECDANPFPVVAEDGVIHPDDDACLGIFVRIKRSFVAYARQNLGETIKLNAATSQEYIVRRNTSVARWAEGFLVVALAILVTLSLRRPARRFTPLKIIGLGFLGLAAVLFSGVNAQLAYLGGLLVLTAIGLCWMKRCRAKKPVSSR